MSDPLAPHHPHNHDGAEAAGPACLRRRLDEAFEGADFTARVDTGLAPALVSATLYTGSKMPFASPEEAAAWLEKEAVDASARLDDMDNIVIDLRTASAVELLISVLLGPHIRAQTTATGLHKVLADHGLEHTVHVLVDSIVVILRDSAEQGTATTLAGLLGAPHLDAGLDLNLDGDLRRFADHLALLITGAVGSLVLAGAVPGCAHEPDQVTLGLTLDQARLLTLRLGLTRVPDADPSSSASQ
ncbi:hypothetical protein [Streptomyces hokutonensis]|uniref:hypothetical protein n=1 Tax=Streptomyces hokutonensis TaxID=1306990 RepID=UPI00036922D6|nr:hypothetical protein [Streptomyces hokutonensis]